MGVLDGVGSGVGGGGVFVFERPVDLAGLVSAGADGGVEGFGGVGGGDVDEPGLLDLEFAVSSVGGGDVVRRVVLKVLDGLDGLGLGLDGVEGDAGVGEGLDDAGGEGGGGVVSGVAVFAVGEKADVDGGGVCEDGDVFGGGDGDGAVIAADGDGLGGAGGGGEHGGEEGSGDEGGGEKGEAAGWAGGGHRRSPWGWGSVGVATVRVGLGVGVEEAVEGFAVAGGGEALLFGVGLDAGGRGCAEVGPGGVLGPLDSGVGGLCFGFGTSGHGCGELQFGDGVLRRG